MFPKTSKYRAVKTEIDGIIFDSKKEARHYSELKLLQNAGIISKIELQIKFPIEVCGKKICSYICDFQITYPDGHIEIIDVKGMKTRIYILKKKLVEAIYNIKIIEK